MRPKIAINTLCFANPELGAAIEAVARIGVQAITPDLEHVMALGPALTAQNLRDAGLAIAGLTHRAFGFAHDELAAEATERLNRTIDVAAQIGAPTIIMTTGGRGLLAWPEANQRFAGALALCAERARAAGIRLAIEPTSHLYADASIAHRLSDTLQIARTAGIDVVIDLFACWFDSDIDAALTAAVPGTALVQVSDYVPGDRSLPCRAVPGDGVVPLECLVGSIVRAGYAGWFDLEVIGPRLQIEGEEAGLKRAASVLTEILGRITAEPASCA